MNWIKNVCGLAFSIVSALISFALVVVTLWIGYALARWMF